MERKVALSCTWRRARAALVVAVALAAPPAALAEGSDRYADSAERPAGYASGNPVGYDREPGPLSGTAESLDRSGRVPFDVVFQRPLEFVLLGIGAVVWLPSYPVGWLFGVGPEVTEICITQPYARVFDTPLGEL